MTNAPERIWASDPDIFDDMGFYEFSKNDPRSTEYVRADLVDDLEAENQRLREALRDIDLGPGGGWSGALARDALNGEGET